MGCSQEIRLSELTKFDFSSIAQKQTCMHYAAGPMLCSTNKARILVDSGANSNFVSDAYVAT